VPVLVTQKGGGKTECRRGGYQGIIRAVGDTLARATEPLVARGILSPPEGIRAIRMVILSLRAEQTHEGRVIDDPVPSV
jgi:hypothetical protein